MAFRDTKYNNALSLRPGLRRGFLKGFHFINFIAFSTGVGMLRPAGEGRRSP
jgi:hypothetical protein